MLTFYNTLTARKEEFRPLHDNEVRLYTCGPTVYNYAHIGNLRAYVFADVLRRTLEYNGYKVKQVTNITDVGQLTSDEDEGEDKMVKALKREGKPLTLEAMREVADKYITAFAEDLEALNIEPPYEMPRASEHIKEDIELIQKLKQKGIAYKTNDGVYFDIAQFPAYGTRGGFKLGDLREGARVAVNTEKKHPHDFALWKFSGSGLPAFQSPFGSGFPGWHLECSAMSRKYLGQPFDIHTGGIDHIPVHHQNEIAQSEAAYGVPLANYWMHSEHLNMGTEKMAKSGENFITLQMLKDKGTRPLAYRYALLTSHYRSPINFNPLSQEVVIAGQHSYFNLLNYIGGVKKTGSVDTEYQKEFNKYLNDDLNTSGGLAMLWLVAKEPRISDEDKRATILDFDRVLGLDIENQSEKLAEEMNAVPDDIKKLASAREDARLRKDFQTSDTLREQIRAEGFEVMDTDSGPIIRKKL